MLAKGDCSNTSDIVGFASSYSLESYISAAHSLGHQYGLLWREYTDMQSIPEFKTNQITWSYVLFIIRETQKQ